MTARDDQPDTVPPPAGEDDAYSATTKVGAMPADIMEKLRSEGLLPAENSGERATPAKAFRPSTSLDKRTPIESFAAVEPDSGAAIPALYSTAPGAITTPPPSLDGAPDAEAAMKRTGPPAPLETPVAFAFPPTAELPKLGEAAEESALGSHPAEQTGPASLRGALTKKDVEPPSKTTLYLVAVLVVLALIVALIRLRG